MVGRRLPVIQQIPAKNLLVSDHDQVKVKIPNKRSGICLIFFFFLIFPLEPLLAIYL